MASEGSVTRWLDEVQEGDSAAAEAIWKQYYPELVRLARQRLRGTRCTVADEEDVALSAMDSFFEAAREGRFPDLADRDDLWRLLMRITSYKAIDLIRHQSRQRRGGGARQDPLAEVIGDAPSPEFAAMLAEEYRCRLAQLDDPQLQALAVAKMEGYGNREIAERLDCSQRTVERRLRLIRAKWSQEPPP